MAKMEGYAKQLHALKGEKNIPKKKAILIECAQKLYKEKGRPLVSSDFRPPLPHSKTIMKLYNNSWCAFLEDAGLPLSRRKPNLSFDELKDYLKSIRTEMDSECWLTENYTLDEGGYRLFPINRDAKPPLKGESRIHRVSYILFNGPIPDDLVVKHSCDVRDCYNPNHLSVGTQADNMAECRDRGKRAAQQNRSGGRIRKFLPTDPYDKEQMALFLKANTETIQPFDQMIFCGAKDSYIRVTICGQPYTLHKLIMAQKLGIKYDEIIGVVRHNLPDGSPPNRADCNADHLSLGTQRENTNDSLPYRKDLKLSKQDWLDIYDSYSKEVDPSIRGSQYHWQQRIAKKYGITATHALNLITKTKQRLAHGKEDVMENSVSKKKKLRKGYNSFEEKFFAGIDSMDERKSKLIKFGKDLYSSLGRPLVIRDFRGFEDRPPEDLICKYFGGSFVQFIKSAGLDRAENEKRMREFIDHAKELNAKLGRQPTVKDFNGRFSQSAARKLFGTFGKFLEKAGFNNRLSKKE